MRLRGRIRKVRKKKREPLDIDITSLLDILVIMLVFLLKSYNSSGVVLNIPKGITLPLSESQEPNSTGVIIQVSATTVSVDNKLLIDLTFPDSPEAKDFNRGRRRIAPLYDELVNKRETYKLISKSAPNAKPFSATVNLVIDKSIGFNTIKRILFTSAEAGFIKYRFAVLGEDL